MRDSLTSIAFNALDRRGATYSLCNLQALGSTLNPSFLSKHSVAPLNLIDGVLTVGMVDVEDHQAIAALKFATGLEIAPVPMQRRDVHRRLASIHPTQAPASLCSSSPQRKVDPTRGELTLTLPQGIVAYNGASLVDLVGDWLGSRPRAEAPLVWLGRLLAAGFTPAEAGTIITQAHGRGVCLPAGDLAAAEGLSKGQNLEAALAQAAVSPWLKFALACAHEGADQATIVVKLSDCEAAMAHGRSEARRLVLELAAWTVPALIAWRSISLSACALIAAGIVLIWVNIRAVVRDRPNNDVVRAAVLEIISALARLGMLDSVAIRIGLVRLNSLAPTWGQLPDEREGLARALALPPLTAALLERGDLAEAAARTAYQCRERAKQILERTRWLVRCSGILLVGTATTLLLT